MMQSQATKKQIALADKELPSNWRSFGLWFDLSTGESIQFNPAWNAAMVRTKQQLSDSIREETS